MHRIVRNPAITYPPAGQALYNRIVDLNCNQKDFAELAGISRSYLSRLICGRAPISPAMQVKIDTALELLEEELTEYTDSVDAWANRKHKDFTPPINDDFTRERLMKEAKEVPCTKDIPPSLLKEVSDVQHGRKDAVDYDKYTCRTDTSDAAVLPTVTDPCAKEELRNLFIRTAASADLNDNILALFGRAVLCLIGGDE